MSEAAKLKEEGNAKFKASQFAAAVDAYTRSLELDPTQHLCLSNRSAAYLKLGGAAEQALADAERCVELAPSFAKGYSRQAAALQELKRWEEAVKVCERGMAVAPDETVRKMLSEVRARHFQERMQGVWHGTVSEALGGYDQEMEFLEDGRVRVEVLGRSIVGTFWTDCDQEPHNLSIQVPMPDAPPGMPPPPPVPYIARLDDKGLHLCCPFMVMDRPTSFDGPGYCLMARGKLGGDEAATELARLTEDEKYLLCVRELVAALPNTKLEEPKPTDSEEVTREKLMMQVRFESSMFAVQKKFGEESMKTVFSAAKGDSAPPKALAGKPELRQLKEKLSVCGLLEDGDANKSAAAPPRPAAEEPAAAAMPTPASAPAARSPAEAGPAEAAAPSDGRDATDKDADDDDGTWAVVAASLVFGAAAVAAGLWFWQQRRRR